MDFRCTTEGLRGDMCRAGKLFDSPPPAEPEGVPWKLPVKVVPGCAQNLYHIEDADGHMLSDGGFGGENAIAKIINAYGDALALRSARGGVVGVPGESISVWAGAFAEAASVCGDPDYARIFREYAGELRRLLPAPVAKEGS